MQVKQHKIIIKIASLLTLFLIFSARSFSQVKIGDKPTVITKSAILELESDRQALLITRMADFLQINLLLPKEGMLVYLKETVSAGNDGVYICTKGAPAPVWQRVATEGTSWSTKGNNIVNPAENRLGSTNSIAVDFITNNAVRMSIDPAGAVSIINNLAVGGNLSVGGSITFKTKTITFITNPTYTLAADDYMLNVDAAGGLVTVSLPVPAATNKGIIYVVKKIAGGLANDVIIDAIAAANLEGGDSQFFPLYNDWTVVKFQSDGAKWLIVK